MDIREKNIAAMKKAMPRFTLRRDEEEKGAFVTEQTKLGYPTCKYEAGGKALYMHSRFNPEKEGLTFADALSEKMEKSKVIILFGLGFGYEAKAILGKKPKDAVFIIIEPSWDAFAKAIEAVDLSELILNENVSLAFGRDPKTAEAALGLYVKPDNFEGLTLAFQPAYKNIFQQEAMNLTAMVHSRVSRNVADVKTTYLNAFYWAKSTLINTKYILESKSLSLFKDVLANRPAIVVAAGPSLDKNIALLHEVKDKFIIIATYTALRALRKHHITPDFIVSLDSMQTVAESPEEKERMFDIPIAYISISDTQLLDRCKGGKIFCHTQYDELLASILPEGKRDSDNLIFYSGTVSITGMDLARCLGANPIIMIGQDLAHTNHKSHAAGTVYRDNEALENDQLDNALVVYVDGIDGNKVESTFQLSSYIKCIEEYMACYPNIRFIDATEGGALIKGAEIKTLEDTICQYDGDFSSVGAVIRQTMAGEDLFTKEDRREAVKNIALQSALASELKQYAEEGIAVSEKLEALYFAQKLSEGKSRAAVKKFQDLDASINAVLQKTRLFVTMYEAVEIKLNAHLPSDENTRQLYSLRHNHMLYKNVNEMCDFVIAGLSELALSLEHTQ